MYKLLITIIMLFPSITMAEVSIYRGFATTHLFTDNTNLNNNNGVTAISVNNIVFGRMKNSYKEPSYFAGYMPKVWDEGRFEVNLGGLYIEEYSTREQVLIYRRDVGSTESVIVVTPAVGASVDITDRISVQGILLGKLVANVGIRFDF